MEKDVVDVIILGSGPAGYTAALYAARANLAPLIICGRQKGGQLMTTTDVENWPGDIHGLTGPKLMARMEEHVRQFELQIIDDHATRIDCSQRPFRIETERGSSYLAQTVIIATGASAQYLGLPSEQAFLGKGVSGCATCDGFFYKKAPVAVIGGGNTAVEEALYLSHICSHVTLIHRRDSLRAEKILQDRLFQKEKEGLITILWNCELQTVVGDNNGVTGAVLWNNQSQSTQEIAIDGLFIAIGHTPNTSLFQGQLHMEEGYIITRSGPAKGSTMTSVAGIFAAGDVADRHYRQAITSAGSGCMAALDVEAFLSEHGRTP